MKSIEAPQKTNLYETDYILWIEEQVKALSEHNEKALDWYNLKEEINSLGKEQINAIHSFLKQIIIINMLKTSSYCFKTIIITC